MPDGPQVRLHPRRILRLGRPARIASPELAQRWDEAVGFNPLAGDIVRIAGHSAMAAVAIYTGVKGDGLWSALGWVVGVGTGACALVEIADLFIPEGEAAQ